MNDLEIQAKIAQYIGWTDLTHSFSAGLWGRPPKLFGDLQSIEVPDYVNDRDMIVAACEFMATKNPLFGSEFGRFLMDRVVHETLSDLDLRLGYTGQSMRKVGVVPSIFRLATAPARFYAEAFITTLEEITC